MSAKILPPEALGFLGAVAVETDCVLPILKDSGKVGGALAADVAEFLWSANVAAVRHRYPDAGDRLPGPRLPLDRQKHWIRWYARKCSSLRSKFSLSEVLVMLRTLSRFEYEVCELLHWSTSEVKAQVNRLHWSMTALLPGYRESGPFILRKPEWARDV